MVRPSTSHRKENIVKQLVAAVAFVLTAVVVSAADFSGTWTVQGDVANNAVDFVCKLNQVGEKLSGTAALEGKEVPVSGSVKDRVVTFTFDVEHEGSTYTNVFKGTLRDDGVINGTIEVAGQGGTFTAKKH
jgi:hypothetical protein